MEIFGNLFKRNTLTTFDAEFGEIQSFSTRGNEIYWKFNKQFLNVDIEILISGDKDGISNNQKQILLNALKNEPVLKSESEKALKEQFENAELPFVSLEKHFEPNGITVNNEGVELTFQEKEGQNYFFTIHFENNKQVGVSIDG